MPAKRKRLPRPCPICKRKNGTIQLALTARGLIVRIGHYSSKLRNAEKGSWVLRKNQDIDKKHSLWKTERKWCSFRAGSTRIVERNLTAPYMFASAPPICFSPPQGFFQYVALNGWDLEPNSKSNYKGRVRKNIDYFEKQIKSS